MSKEFTCPECNREFNSAKGLGSHRWVKHNVIGKTRRAEVKDGKGFICPHCQRDFHNLHGLNLHISLKHHGEVHIEKGDNSVREMLNPLQTVHPVVRKAKYVRTIKTRQPIETEQTESPSETIEVVQTTQTACEYCPHCGYHLVPFNDIARMLKTSNIDLNTLRIVMEKVQSVQNRLAQKV